MCNPELRERIEGALKEIEKLKENSPPLPDDWELALELGVDDDTREPICSYYFVCISTRCLFWLHDFDLGSILLKLRGVTEKTHIRKSAPTSGIHKTKDENRPVITSSVLVGNRRIPTMASWLMALRLHWEMFPHNREIPEQLMQELTGILLHAGIGTSEPGLDVMWLTVDLDCMTSPNSTTIYSEGDLNKLLGYVRHIKTVGGNFGFSACIVGMSSVLPRTNASDRFPGRLMSFFSTFPSVCGRILES